MENEQIWLVAFTYLWSKKINKFIEVKIYTLHE